MVSVQCLPWNCQVDLEVICISFVRYYSYWICLNCMKLLLTLAKGQMESVTDVLALLTVWRFVSDALWPLKCRTHAITTAIRALMQLMSRPVKAFWCSTGHKGGTHDSRSIHGNKALQPVGRLCSGVAKGRPLSCWDSAVPIPLWSFSLSPTTMLNQNPCTTLSIYTTFCWEYLLNVGELVTHWGIFGVDYI